MDRVYPRSGKTATRIQRDPSIDAVVTIAPETVSLTSGGKVGTGSVGSVKGAKLLVSTRTINRLIADVVAFRPIMTIMWKDPIVEEIHRVRRELAQQYEYDLKALVADLQREQEASGRAVVTLQPKRIVKKAQAA